MLLTKIHHSRLFQARQITNSLKCQRSKLVVKDGISAKLIHVTESVSVPIYGKILVARVRDRTSEINANTVRNDLSLGSLVLKQF